MADNAERPVTETKYEIYPISEMQKRDDAKCGLATLRIGGMGVAAVFEKV